MYRSSEESREPRAAFLCGSDAHNTYANAAYQKMTGCTAEELKGLGWAKCVHPDDFPGAWKQVSSFTEQEGFNVELRLMHKNGSWRWVSCQSVDLSGAFGDEARFVGIIQDITWRKQTEESLRLSEERFALAVQGSNDGLWDWDISNNKVFCSERYREILDISDGQVDDAMAFFEARLHPDFKDPFKQAFKEYIDAKNAEAPFHLEALVKKGNEDSQDYCWVRIRGQALWGKDGVPLRMAGSLSDITERKAWEQEQERLIANLAEARDKAESAANARSEFLAVMSHEIKTPLNGVIGMATLLMDTNPTPEQQECLEILQTSGECLLSIINDILDFSKIDAGKLTISTVPCNIRSLVEDVCSMLALRVQPEVVELVVNYRAPLVAFFADAMRLKQVLLNLIGNACKFTHEGHILVDVSLMCGRCKHVVDSRDACFRFCREEEQCIRNSFDPAQPGANSTSICWLKFSIIDSGIGIPRHRLGLLFQKFSQCDRSTSRTYGGTGLGLAVSKSLVELMGGNIAVESEDGKGSTFTICIPLLLDDVAEGTHQKQKLNKIFRGRKVLVIDDHPMSALVLCEQLRSFGFQTKCLELEDAMEQLEQASSSYDVVFVDSLLLDRLREELPAKAFGALKIIVLKPVRQRILPEELDLAHFCACVNRPIRQPYLKDALLKALDIPVSSLDEPVSASTSMAKPVTRKPHILVVEDNKVNQMVAMRLLTSLGCSIDIACNGKEAVKVILDGPRQYDLIFMDCHMPVMDGFEAARLIRQLAATVPIVALTAVSTEADLHRCTESGMDDHVSKPCTKAELRRILEKWWLI